jgi:hypothetical protein
MNLQHVKTSVIQKIIEHRFILKIYLKSQEKTYSNIKLTDTKICLDPQPCHSISPIVSRFTI